MVAHMARDGVWLSVEGERAAHILHEARKMLESAQDEVVLDFASVQRIDSGALRALDELADTASGKGIQLVLNNVSVDIYKVLKLMGLTSRFSFRA
jgi:anti-anti-sigma factor